MVKSSLKCAEQVVLACYPRKAAPKGRNMEMSEENIDIFDEEEMENLVYLSDEDGNEVAFEYLDSVEYKGDEYVVLISTDEDDDEVVILKVSRRETRIISTLPSNCQKTKKRPCRMRFMT